jgi:hypothetical protein
MYGTFVYKIMTKNMKALQYNDPTCFTAVCFITVRMCCTLMIQSVEQQLLDRWHFFDDFHQHSFSPQGLYGCLHCTAIMIRKLIPDWIRYQLYFSIYKTSQFSSIGSLYRNHESQMPQSSDRKYIALFSLLLYLLQVNRAPD